MTIEAAPTSIRARGLDPMRHLVDRETGELGRVEGPRGFTTWQTADEAARFLVARPVPEPAEDHRRGHLVFCL